MSKLDEIYSRPVPSYFPPSSPCSLAFLGEAPSYEECEKLAPFVGPSGSMLNAMLRAANIDRQACFVGNAISTKLEENDLSTHRKLIGEAAFTQLWESNKSRVHAELAKANPTVVVALGNTALQMLTGRSGVQSWRGHPMYGDEPFIGRTIFPTFHPSHILKSYNTFPIMIGDLIRAAALSAAGGKIAYPQRTLNITPSITEVETALEAWKSASLLSCDIETGWGMIRGVSFSPRPWKEALYVPFVSLSALDRSYWRTVEEERRAWKAVRDILQHPVPKLGQNFAAYDIVWLLAKMGIRVMNAREDTRLLHAALYPELPKSLEFMGAAYSTQGAWKVWGRAGWTRRERQEKRDA